ncbi:hypothetical protein RR48_01063 [Papilio machaon]|uniref:Uncharacterized protein n=1 Tax=Papilio machaon TaxID=76193 RepID=A0A0N1IQ39_PAPMA|nr:hypothetical protein RR48_01063 [Papilio machaon]
MTTDRIISESVFEGSRFVNDRLLHRSDHVKRPYFIRSEDIAFPKYNEERGNLITSINIIDNLDNGASAEIDYGGIGYTDITELEDSHNESNTENEITNGRIHMTLKQYHCAWNDSNKKEKMTKWSFGSRNAKLKLNTLFINVSSHYQETIKSNDVITKFNVSITIDNTYSRGYITSGGILQDHISLSFVFSGITSLSYQFWLYGLPDDYVPRVDPHTNIYNMC